MDSTADLDALWRRVQQLESENADLRRQVAALGAGEPRSHPAIERPKVEATSQFHAFMIHAPMLAWMTDAQGVMGYANPAWLALVGVSAQQALGQTLEALFPPELAEEYRRNNQWVIDHQAVLETTEQALAPNGTVQTFLVRKFPIYSTGETTAWVGGIGIDITQLQQAEAALRDSEARWQFALEGAGDGLWDWNLQTNQLFYSPQWKVMLGYADDEIGTSLDEWDSRVHPDDKAHCYTLMEKHFSGETPLYQQEYRIRCKDGGYKWILDRGKVMQWDGQGKPLRVIGTHKDITNRKQIEEDLRQSEATNRAILAAIPDLLVRVGRDGTCYDFRLPVDGSRGQFLRINQHLSEVLPPDLLAYQLQRIEQGLATGSLQVWEQQLEKQGVIT